MSDIPENAKRHRGEPRDYDRYRPQIPAAVVRLVSGLAPSPLERVVDIGCATGLSTRVWVDHAAEVIGMDPNPVSLAFARERGGPRYEARTADDTGLPSASVDLVTVVTAIHWIDGDGLLDEARRILRPNGLLASISAGLPPTIGWAIDEATLGVYQGAAAMRRERGVDATIGPPSRDDPFERAREHGFAAVKRLAMHHEERRDAASILGFMRSLGDVATMLREGVGEHELGLTRLRGLLGDREHTVTWTWYLRLAR